MKMTIRIIASPFVFGIQFVWLLFCCFKNTFLFIKHGGEWITYNDEYTKATIYRIFEELKNQNKDNSKSVCEPKTATITCDVIKS